MMTDPIADMLTRIRNGLQARQAKVDVPGSNLKQEIARVLKEEGYIQNYKFIQNEHQGVIRIFFRKGAGGEEVIRGLSRVSKPGCRLYCRKDEIPKVHGGLGISIVSTARGVMTGSQATREGVGGEILCNVW
jgi:small subunit ribosomal protein S8